MHKEKLKLCDTEPQSPMLKRYEEIAQIMTGIPDVNIEDGIKWVSELIMLLNIRLIATYGIKSVHFAKIIKKTSAASSMNANPIELTYNETDTFLSMAL
ncbi:MAG: hypothetical protein H8D34_19895 [Chloroflexi bacterium]|nr:hypothetical protein [Chloroflexota bacterium]